MSPALADPAPRARARAWLEHGLRDQPPARRLRGRLAARALQAVPAPRGRPLEILDAGCGEGLLTASVAAGHPDWRICAVDLDTEALARTAELARGRRLANVETRRVDITSELPAAAFDVVLAMECLAEIPDVDSAVAGLAQSLRSGGTLLLHVPQASWTPVLPASPREWRHEVHHGFSPTEMQELLERHGLTAVQIRPSAFAAVHLAQELRDRTKRSSLKIRIALFPLMALAVSLELAGWRPGAARALFVKASRP